MSPDAVIGAIIAGGLNTRYGALKAFETVGTQRIIDRVIHTLRSVTPELILIANDANAYAEADLPMRPDAIAGIGALGGLHSALQWAEELGASGILAVACDMPFLNADLLRMLIERAAVSGADVVSPESGGRRGIEPLCAYYSVRCLPAIEQAITRGDQRMIGFHDQVVIERIPLEEVIQFGDPTVLFMNVNTREERALAEQIAAGRDE